MPKHQVPPSSGDPRHASRISCGAAATSRSPGTRLGAASDARAEPAGPVFSGPVRGGSDRQIRSGCRWVPTSPLACLCRFEPTQFARCDLRSGRLSAFTTGGGASLADIRARGSNISYEYLASFTSGAFFSTGASLFERVQEPGTPWVNTPIKTGRKYLHIGHMSWAGEDAYLPEHHSAKLPYI